MQAPSEKLPERETASGGAQNWRGPGQPVFLPRLQLEAAFSLFVPVSFKTSRCLESSFRGHPFWVASETRPDPYFDDSALNYSVSAGREAASWPAQAVFHRLCCARVAVHTQPASLGLWGLAPLLSVPGGGEREAIQLEPTGRTLALSGFMSNFLRSFPSFWPGRAALDPPKNLF